MSYADAIAFAASLAATLMVSIVVFEAGDGTHGAYLNSQSVLQFLTTIEGWKFAALA